MDIGLIFLTLALLVLVGLFVARPLMAQNKQDQPDEESAEIEHDLSALLAERDRILNALQELDFDFTLGKIPEEDYPHQRAELLGRGADILRQLDTMQTGLQAEDAEARIEAVIAAHRADGQAAGGQAAYLAGNGRQVGGAALKVAPDDEIEALLSGRRRARKEKAAGFCPQCGDPVHKSDRFCPKCGKTLTQ